jgi:hypothetical protein
MAHASHEAARSAREVSSSVARQVKDVVDDAGDIAGGLADQGSQSASTAGEQAKTLAGEIEAMARRNPLGVLAGAVAIGFLIGVWGEADVVQLIGVDVRADIATVKDQIEQRAVPGQTRASSLSARPLILFRNTPDRRRTYCASRWRSVGRLCVAARSREGVAQERGAFGGDKFSDLDASEDLGVAVALQADLDESKRDRIESERQRNIDMVINGVIGEDDARTRIADLKAQRLQVEAEIAMLEEAPKIITLHPATLDRYVETVDALAACIAEHAEAEDDRGSLVKGFRALVHSVTVRPNGPREGFQVEVKGKLALVGGDAFPQAIYSGGSVVAEARYIVSPTMDDTLFCYWRRVA